jgi:geranylgeranyl diphosphate synthase, type II
VARRQPDSHREGVPPTEPPDVLDDLMGAGARPGDTRLWDAVRTAARGGRRVRPQILLLAHDALAAPGQQVDRAAAEQVAAAVELLHTAFLAHDDVIDGDTVRRGRPNVAGRYETEALTAGASSAAARTYGTAAGILAGDLALATSFRLVATSTAPPEVVARLLELFDETLHLTADGELADVWSSLAPCTMLEDVLTTAERKTAVYTFGLPLRAGAVLAGRPDLDGPLTRLGRELGLAFQLRDDLAGTFGDPAVTGKSASSDLRTGKETALVALARETTAWPHIAPVLGDPDATDEDHDRVRSLLRRCGARARVERLAVQHETTAAGLADELGLSALVDLTADVRTCVAVAA